MVLIECTILYFQACQLTLSLVRLHHINHLYSRILNPLWAILTKIFGISSGNLLLTGKLKLTRLLVLNEYGFVFGRHLDYHVFCIDYLFGSLSYHVRELEEIDKDSG